MIIKLVPRVGGEPIVLDVSQFVAYNAHGTPISVGAEYGSAGTQAVSTVANPEEFNRFLKMLGVNTTVIVETLQLPKPAQGARLLVGPNS